jgi:hypothetical protein
MTQIEELERAVTTLSSAEYRRFRKWFLQRDWEAWDRQIEEDSDSGKLDFLLKEAEKEKSEGESL